MAFSKTTIGTSVVVEEQGTLTPKSIEITPNGTAGTKTTIQSSQTSNRFITLPDANDTLVGQAVSQTLTNKTIDADLNTITNIENADIKAAAAIDATKIANGTVSNAEFQFLDGVTSSIQTQLDSKAPSATAVTLTGTQTLTNKTLTAPVINSPTGLVKADVGLGNVDNTSDATKNAAIATLTNKTIDADLNTITNIENADIKVGAAIDAAKIANGTVSNAEFQFLDGVTSAIQTQINAKADASTAVTLAGVQALTNKDYDGGTASNTSRLTVPQGTKTALDALTRKEATLVYANDQDKLYVDNGSFLTPVGSGSGQVNFIANPDAETGTTGWATYADAAGTIPVDGTGGSPNVTFTTSSSSPLVGTNSFIFTKDAANRQGQGVSYDFTIDSAYQAKVLNISFNYLVNSGTFAAGSSTTNSDVIVYLYDITNATLIEPSSIKLLSNSTTIADTFQASFQTPSNSTSYRLILHVSTTSTSAYSLKLDNFAVSPSNYVYGTPVTDWQFYTPTWSSDGTAPTLGNGAITGLYRRVGDSFEIRARLLFGSTSTKGTGTYSISIPPGFTIDTNKLSSSAVNTNSLGTAWYQSQTSNASFQVQTVALNNSTSVRAVTDQNATFPFFNSTQSNVFNATNDSWNLNFSVPVVGLSSSVQMSDSYDGRIIATSYASSSATAITSTPAGLTYNTLNYDLTGSMSGGSTFIVPSAGLYRVSGMITLTSSSWSTGQLVLTLKNNGTNVGTIARFAQGTASAASAAISASGSVVVQCNAGDALTFFASQTQTASINLNSVPLNNFIQIEKLQGPQTISANEIISCRYESSAGGTISTSATLQSFSTKIYDTHNAWSGNRFTAPIAGFYRVDVSLLTAGNVTIATNGSTLMELYKNGSTYSRICRTVGNGAANVSYTAGGTDVVQLNAGEYIEIYCLSSVATSQTATASYNHVSVTKVG